MLYNEVKIKECLAELSLSNVDFFNYVTPKGLKELRVNISKYLYNRLNTKINPNNMIITSGSQQSIYLLARTLLNKSDSVISEEPTYFGAIEVFKEVGANVLTVKVDNNGIDLDSLKEHVKKEKSKLIYVVPTFNNPTGVSWSNDQRREFLEIVNKNNIIVIEDAPYSDFNYTDTEFKSLYELNEGKNVVYLGTFSKVICPSLSVGYILAEESVIDNLYRYKLLNDMNTSAFIQHFVNLYLEKYNIEEDIENKRAFLKERADYVKKELTKNNIRFSNMQGGLFLAAYLPYKKKPESQYDNYFYNLEAQNLLRINILDDKLIKKELNYG